MAVKDLWLVCLLGMTSVLSSPTTFPPVNRWWEPKTTIPPNYGLNNERHPVYPSEGIYRPPSEGIYRPPSEGIYRPPVETGDSPNSELPLRPPTEEPDFLRNRNPEPVVSQEEEGQNLGDRSSTMEPTIRTKYPEFRRRTSTGEPLRYASDRTTESRFAADRTPTPTEYRQNPEEPVLKTDEPPIAPVQDGDRQSEGNAYHTQMPTEPTNRPTYRSTNDPPQYPTEQSTERPLERSTEMPAIPTEKPVENVPERSTDYPTNPPTERSTHMPRESQESTIKPSVESTPSSTQRSSTTQQPTTTTSRSTTTTTTTKQPTTQTPAPTEKSSSTTAKPIRERIINYTNPDNEIPNMVIHDHLNDGEKEADPLAEVESRLYVVNDLELQLEEMEKTEGDDFYVKLAFSKGLMERAYTKLKEMKDRLSDWEEETNRPRSRKRRTSYFVSSMRSNSLNATASLQVHLLKFRQQDTCEDKCMYNVSWWEHDNNMTDVKTVNVTWGKDGGLYTIKGLKFRTRYVVKTCIMNQPQVNRFNDLYCNDRKVWTRARNEQVNDVVDDMFGGELPFEGFDDPSAQSVGSNNNNNNQGSNNNNQGNTNNNNQGSNNNNQGNTNNNNNNQGSNNNNQGNANNNNQGSNNNQGNTNNNNNNQGSTSNNDNQENSNNDNNNNDNYWQWCPTDRCTCGCS